MTKDNWNELCSIWLKKFNQHPTCQDINFYKNNKLIFSELILHQNMLTRGKQSTWWAPNGVFWPNAKNPTRGHLVVTLQTFLECVTICHNRMLWINCTSFVEGFSFHPCYIKIICPWPIIVLIQFLMCHTYTCYPYFDLPYLSSRIHSLLSIVHI